MKKVILALLVLVTAQQAWAQHAKTETLFRGRQGKTTVGAYGMPAVKFTPVDDKFGVIVGAHGGVLLNNKLMLGAGGYASANNIDAPRIGNSTENQYWQLWYTGFVAEYIHRSEKLVHWTAGALIGGGGVSRRDRWDSRHDYGDSWHDHSGFFVAEPFASLEINLTRFMRLDIGGSYRFVQGSSTEGITDAKLRGPSAHIGIKAGVFK